MINPVSSLLVIGGRRPPGVRLCRPRGDLLLPGHGPEPLGRGGPGQEGPQARIWGLDQPRSRLRRTQQPGLGGRRRRQGRPASSFFTLPPFLEKLVEDARDFPGKNGP